MQCISSYNVCNNYATIISYVNDINLCSNFSALKYASDESGSGNGELQKSRRGNDKKPLEIGSGNRNRRQNQPLTLPKWQIGTQMPSVRARSCAVATDDNTFYVLGNNINLPLN